MDRRHGHALRPNCVCGTCEHVFAVRDAKAAGRWRLLRLSPIGWGVAMALGFALSPELATRDRVIAAWKRLFCCDAHRHANASSRLFDDVQPVPCTEIHPRLLPTIGILSCSPRVARNRHVTRRST